MFDAEKWGLIWTHRQTFIDGTVSTLLMALFGLILAMIVGISVGLMATSHTKPLHAVSRVYVEVIQNTPVMLQALFLFYAVTFAGVKGFSALLCGIIALGIYHGAYISEVIRTGIQSVPKGQSEAAYSQGFGQIATMAYIVLPQTFKNIVPTLLSQVITTVKDTSYIANIAIAELMGKTFQLIQISPRYTGFTTQNVSDVFVLCGLACVIYFAINFTLSCVVRRMQKPKKRVSTAAAV